MAPGLVETPAEAVASPVATYKGPTDYKETGAVAGGPKAFNLERELNGNGKQAKAKYPNYLPTWDTSIKYPPLEPFEHYEHGKDADLTFPNLLKNATVTDVTGNIGAEVRGVQISQLNNAGKDELALFVAQKKVVAFRDQDWSDIPIGDAVEFVKYFGRLHIHPTSPAPAGHPEVHVVFRGIDDTNAAEFFEDRISSVAWHTDISYEEQPPGTTFLYMLDGPTAGGDTIFSNQVVAYNRLSPAFRERLHGLFAVHSAHEQAAMSASNAGAVRRAPVSNIHPLIREHPATGEKALYVNPQFTRRIVGYKKEESDALLKFLFDHVAYGADFHARVKWAPGTVVVWDNRVTSHTAIVDWENGQRRHIARITPQAEKPREAKLDAQTA